MKIQSLQDPSGIVHEENKKAGRTSVAGSSFQQFLDESVAAGIQQGSAVQGPGASGGDVSSLMGALNPTEAQGMRPLMGVLDGALGQLDHLCGHGAEAHPDLKAVAQALTELGQTADAISRQAQSLAEGHPLRRLAEEARVLAYVESVKWRRGDYL